MQLYFNSNKLIAVLSTLMPLFSLSYLHGNSPTSTQEENYVEEHIGDGYSWHFFTLGHTHATLHLPIIAYIGGTQKKWVIFSSHNLWDSQHRPQSYCGVQIGREGTLEAIDGNPLYDFSITKNVAGILLSLLLILIFALSFTFYLQGGNYVRPRGLWILPIMMVLFIRDNIAKKNIGEKKYLQFTPYLLTLFCFILLNNLLGLMPGGANITGNISVTLALSIYSTLYTFWHANYHFWEHLLFPSFIPKAIWPIYVPIEIVSLISKTIVLALRLFINMVIGHFVMIGFIGIIFTMESKAIAITMSLFMTIGLLLLKIFVSFIQAYVFTLLTAIFIGSAVKEKDLH